MEDSAAEAAMDPKVKKKSTAEDVAAWRDRAEQNRQLRQQYAADPKSLSPDDLRRAVVLLERDQRKLRQAEQGKTVRRTPRTSCSRIAAVCRLSDLHAARRKRRKRPA